MSAPPAASHSSHSASSFSNKQSYRMMNPAGEDLDTGKTLDLTAENTEETPEHQDPPEAPRHLRLKWRRAPVSFAWLMGNEE